MDLKATEPTEIALPRGREKKKVHAAKKYIALGWNIIGVSGKLSSGTLPPRSDAPSENYTAPLPGSQSAGSGHSASVCRLSLPHLLQWCRVTGARCPRGASVSSSHQRQSLRGRELKRESVCRDTQLAAAKQCSIKKNNFSPVLNINRYIYIVRRVLWRTLSHSLIVPAAIIS